LLHPVADQVDEPHFAPHTPAATGGVAVGAGITIPVASRAATCLLYRRLTFPQPPMPDRFLEWTVDNRFWNLETASRGGVMSDTAAPPLWSVQALRDHEFVAPVVYDLDRDLGSEIRLESC
jgi:hypothetical protein